MFSRAAVEAARVARSVPLRTRVAAAASAAAGAAAVGGATVLCDDAVHTVEYDWPHSGFLQTFDHAAIRRGWQVYREVCSTCHSIKFVAFRNLIGVSHSEAEVKKIAAEFEVEDGPNDEGEMFERPAKPSDRIPGPYKNEASARAANNGAYPPDLSLVVKGRHLGHHYVMSLLTGYTEAPVGKDLLPGLHYNPYFPGTSISMPPPLMDGQVEYPDGTPATVSQMAKDVTTFLAWCAEPEMDERKRMGMKWCSAMFLGLALSMYYKRFRWSPLKTRKITYHDINR
ncbi:unnamed protein product [Ectocarpus sp. 13 AM-2016]